MRSALALGLALALVTSPHARAQVELRDLTVEQSAVAQVAVKPSTLAVALAADRADATYAIGETVRLTLTTNEDAYVVAYSIGASGAVTQLFPNAYQRDNKLAAGKPVEIGGGASVARIVASGTPGPELIKVVASTRPIAVVSESRLLGQGAYRSVEGGASALTRDLQVVSAQTAQPEAKVAFFATRILTVAARPAVAEGTTVTIAAAPGPAAPAANVITLPTQPGLGEPIVIAGSQPFPLLLASDRASAKPGDRITVAATTVAACTLTVFDVSPSGRVKMLYPTQPAPAPALAALQTAFVAGGSAPAVLAAAAEPGLQQIVAVCSSDPAPVASPATTDKAALLRDLAAAAARPAGTTAMAVTNLTVAP